ncbi:DNA-binding protein [bacterium]|nr:DNA-binding protein [bacterium]MBU1652185.1 DNA-binding protein [bacterium]MBU1882585.1 DNA-binding protein [bacterium]
MKLRQYAEGLLVKLEIGEEVTDTLTHFMKENDIQAGIVQGLGGVADAELGFYDLNKREYLHQVIPGNLELVHYYGNITMVDGKPFIHAHAVVSGPDYIAKAGHFISAKISVTGEFLIKPSAWGVNRRYDETTGLKLMDI